MHSHTSIVHNGPREYLLTLTHQLCQQLQSTGSLSLDPNAYLSGLKKNSIDTRSLIISVTVTTDGTCKGLQYSDPFGIWDDVVIQALVRITLRDYYAPIKIQTDQVQLKSRTIGSLNEEN